MPTRRSGHPYFWSAVSGVVAAGAALAVSELAALLTARSTSPILAVGSFVIDIVPRPLKELAIATFGDADKIVLLASVALAVVIGAAIAGLVQYRKPPFGAILLVLAMGAATAAVLTRAGATPLDAIPPVAGAIAGAVMIILLVRQIRSWPYAVHARRGAAVEDVTPEDPAAPTTATPDAPLAGTQLNRRSFFVLAAVTAASAAVIGFGSRALTAVTSSIEAVRDALRLPSPRSRVTVPAGAELDVDGLTPLFTSNEDFYRVDTALTVPSVDPASWKLVIDGMVDKRVELSFDDLVGMGLDEYAITLTCVSNEVGGELVGNAMWLGVPLRDVLALAGPQGDADMVLSRSVDGYTASTPLSMLIDDGVDAILAVGMNGEPLPFEHGFPVRMVVPGLYGYVSATKWLTELKVTTFAKDEAYWTPRGYSAEAPIKFASRVDTPKIGKRVAAGTVPIAGVAWAQGVGIQSVEVSIDDGDWVPATLSSPINNDTWVQWMLEWDATPGTHYVAVRAINKNGDLQIQESAPIAPDGSSGWQRTLVSVSD